MMPKYKCTCNADISIFKLCHGDVQNKSKEALLGGRKRGHHAGDVKSMQGRIKMSC